MSKQKTPKSLISRPVHICGPFKSFTSQRPPEKVVSPKHAMETDKPQSRKSRCFRTNCGRPYIWNTFAVHCAASTAFSDLVSKSESWFDFCHRVTFCLWPCPKDHQTRYLNSGCLVYHCQQGPLPDVSTFRTLCGQEPTSSASKVTVKWLAQVAWQMICSVDLARFMSDSNTYSLSSFQYVYI